MKISEEDYFAHYGILRKSGRYPWGSTGNVEGALYPWAGDKPQAQIDAEFLDIINEHKKAGLSEAKIGKIYGISSTDVRAVKSIAKSRQRASDISKAQRLRDKGMSHGEIGKRFDPPRNESSIRAMLAPGNAEKVDILKNTANMLKDKVDEHTYIDVGTGVEARIGLSTERLRAAVALLKEEGYNVYKFKFPQLGTGLDTEMKVLTDPKTTWSDMQKNQDKIRNIDSYTKDSGRGWSGLLPPLQIDPKRVAVKYGPDGGAEADGVILVRPGVPDVSLGGSRYAQVRVAVGPDHYLKGMAVYSDKLPKGVDLLFNTNKDDTGNKLDAMKPVSKDLNGVKDEENPFSSAVDQLKETGPDGKEHLTSAMNLVYKEGQWTNWSKTISSQFLSKQPRALAKTQLDMTYEDRVSEFKKISELTNPTVKRSLLKKFSDETDSAAVHLDAYMMPRQAWHVILPSSSLKVNEVYAPNYENGEEVVLVRFPHGGTFEIPRLTVNNKNREAKKMIGDSKDGIAINSDVAERLSGADFDGDTVLVIPNKSGNVKSTPALDGLRNFDPRRDYPKYDGMPKMSDSQKGNEMGYISNLITDMTIREAPADEMAQAIRHSMVVIDAQKHDLNYKQSYINNGIANLNRKYQGKARGGASTLISRATSRKDVPLRKARTVGKGGPIDPETGKLAWEPNTSSRADFSKTHSTKLAETDDAHTLSSGTPIERVYADHSNKLKNLANKARLAEINTPRGTYSASAKQVYKTEVDSLNSKLALAVMNRPLERQAQLLGNYIIKAKKEANPNMTKAEIKTAKGVALIEARHRTGAESYDFDITDKEWEAVQAGAVADSRLQEILRKANAKRVRELATPRSKKLMTPSRTGRAQQMLDSGFTREQVAHQLGVSLSTLDNAIEGV